MYLMWCLLCFPLWLSEATTNVEEFFKDFKCIEEPYENFLFEFIEGESKKEDFHKNLRDPQKNFRNEINSLAQYYDIDPIYEVISEEGPSHQKNFKIALKLGDEIHHGNGKSKKDAREKAAQVAVENTKYEKPPMKIKETVENTPTVTLNNIGLKHGFKIDYYLNDGLMPKQRIINLNKIKGTALTNTTFWKISANLDAIPKSPFTVEVYVQGQSFYGKAPTIQAAKHEAALQAIKYLEDRDFKNLGPCAQAGNKADCFEAKNKIKSPISLLYEYAQSGRYFLDFKALGKTGPDHKPIFTTECTLGEHQVTAEGKSKKESKRNAAQKMLDQLPSLELLEEKLGNNPQRDKKKVQSTLEATAEKIKSFFSRGESEEPTTKTKKTQKNRWSPKESLLNVATSLNLNVEFHTTSRGKNGYHTFVDLNLKPKYICLGFGLNTQISEETSSLNALKFLHKLDLLDGITEDDLKEERFGFNNYIWLTETSD